MSAALGELGFIDAPLGSLAPALGPAGFVAPLAGKVLGGLLGSKSGPAIATSGGVRQQGAPVTVTINPRQSLIAAELSKFALPIAAGLALLVLLRKRKKGTGRAPR